MDKKEYEQAKIEALKLMISWRMDRRCYQTMREPFLKKRIEEIESQMDSILDLLIDYAIEKAMESARECLSVSYKRQQTKNE